MGGALGEAVLGAQFGHVLLQALDDFLSTLEGHSHRLTLLAVLRREKEEERRQRLVPWLEVKVETYFLGCIYTYSFIVEKCV